MSFVGRDDGGIRFWVVFPFFGVCVCVCVGGGSVLVRIFGWWEKGGDRGFSPLTEIAFGFHPFCLNKPIFVPSSENVKFEKRILKINNMNEMVEYMPFTFPLFGTLEPV